MSEFKRILQTGWQHFWRSGTVTFASVLVTTVTLLVVSVVVFANALMGFTLREVAGRVDVNVYFIPGVSEEVVVGVAESVAELSYVENIKVTTADEALEAFRDRHQYDYLTLQALEELDDNPLGASLAIKTVHPDNYEELALFLAPEGGLTDSIQTQIEKVNFYQNELIIERISKLMDFVRNAGIGVSMAFLVLAVVIVMNTVRLAIYSSREEISVMRLIGAPSRLVQGPYFVTGTLYGFFSAVIAAVVLYPVLLFVSEKATAFFGGFSFIAYYQQNLLWVLIILIAIGVVLGILSSALALQKYLKV